MTLQDEATGDRTTPHDDGDGWHDNSKGQQGNGRHNNVDGRLNDGKCQQGDRQHNNGDGQ